MGQVTDGMQSSIREMFFSMAIIYIIIIIIIILSAPCATAH